MQKLLISLVLVMAVAIFWGGCDLDTPTSDLAEESAENNDYIPDLRLASDTREAIKYECFYALNPGHHGGSNKNIGGWAASDWNYLASDLWAYRVLKDWFGGCSSMWKGPHSADPTWGCWPTKSKGQYCFYCYPHNYGLYDWFGRGGQCKYFANLILVRSGTYRYKLPTYQQVIDDYNGSRNYTKLAGEAEVGDVLQTKWVNGHTAVVVEILSGTPGEWSTSIDVVDSNFIGDEIIGRHILDINYSGIWDLDNYIAIDMIKLGAR